ncbi:GntR family transcriptional regulator [Vagococcus sp.]|uniref:GntR family transcriptional regulator n=1 Tax=Vagococcus sp. TaxID=1933889 RepID=UPI003F983AB6
MLITIDETSEEPIYLQLVYELKRLIIIDQMTEGYRLPSVRALAGDLGINLHTVNKAYNQLVDEGVLSKVVRGYQVNALNTRKMTQQIKEDFEFRLKKLMIDQSLFQLSKQEFQELYLKLQNELMKEEDNL